jgi:hypothetical protein
MLPIFVTVARARGDYRYDRERDIVPSGLRLRLRSDRFVVGTVPELHSPEAPEASAAAASAASAAFPNEVMAYVEGGEPNATVRLALGSTRFPNHEPVAAFALDDDTDGLAADLYEGTAAVIAGSVTVDTTDPTHQPATYRFVGDGGLRLADGPVPLLTQQFGLNLWVKFDSLQAGQQLVAQDGAYALELVDDAGQPKLAWRVRSGGTWHEVRSHVSLTTDVWYQAAAHLKDGHLALTVGDDNLVDLGATVTSVDGSFAPVIFGGNLTGNLDDIAAYDFSQAPQLVFDDGSTEFDVVLDGGGEAQVRLSASTTLGVQGRAGERPDVRGMFAQRLGIVPVRIFRTPEPNQPRSEEFGPFDWLKRVFGKEVKDCLEGIAAGEIEEFAAVGCDIFASFLPGVGVYQDFRDGFIVARNFTQGKRSISGYIQATFAIVGIATVAVPGVRALRRAFEAAQPAVRGAAAEARLARQLLKKAQRVIEQGGTETPDLFVRALAGDLADPDATSAVVRLLGACGALHVAAAAAGPCKTLPLKAQQYVDEIAARLYPDAASQAAFLKGLGAAADRAGADAVAMALRGLRRTPKMNLAPEAIEGLAIFVREAPNTFFPVFKSRNRVWKIWDELANPAFEGLTEARANEVANQLFRMIRDGDEKVRLAILNATDLSTKRNLERGWHNFLAWGPGVSRHRRSTGGFYHSIENLLQATTNKIKWIDSKVDRYHGRMDLGVESPTGLLEMEFTRVKPGTKLSGDKIAQLRGKVQAAKARATLPSPRRVDPAILQAELSRMHYGIRGPDRQDLKDQIHNAVLQLLRGKGFEGLSAVRRREIARSVQVEFGGEWPY